MDIIALLQKLDPYLTKTTLRQMNVIVMAILSMTGRITMLGISRWTEKGGSYRTIQRYFNTVMPWASMFCIFFLSHLYEAEAEYILLGDETVVTKAGKTTHGLDRFYAGLFSRVVPGLSFFALSLLNVEQRRSTPIAIEQKIKSDEEKAAAKKKAEKRKKKKGTRKRGRPKGSKNKDKRNVTLSAELHWIQQMTKQLLERIGDKIKLSYFVLDGHFGHNAAIQMVRQCGLHIVSKLKANSALYLPYDGVQSGPGAPQKYGDKIYYDQIDKRFLVSTTKEDDIETKIYQFTAWQKDCPDKLNVVVIHKRHIVTQKWAHVVLFSSDLSLSAKRLVDFYRLRFQIEFNFRDAKQHWGLEDFMNTKETPVTNFANLSLFMVALSQALLPDFRRQYMDFNVLDLKTHFRGHKYVVETLKLLPQKPEPFLLARIFDKISRLGGIHCHSDPNPSS